MKTRLLALAVTVGFVGAGCTFPSSRRLVSRSAVGHVQKIEYGTIEKMNGVVVEGQRGPIGTVGGGLVGSAAASDVGHGAGRALAQAAGAVVGAVAGQAVEEVATRKDALEIVVKLDNGAIVMVTQTSPFAFNVGDRVAVASGGGGARVMLP
jgi:outer membrane lipoprotein SlyB